MGEVLGHESLARHLAHRSKQARIGKSAALDLAADHLLARGREVWHAALNG